HAALQRFWEQVGDSRGLLALSAQDCAEWVATCVEGAADALDAGGEEALPRPALARECRRTVRLIAKLLDIERDRAPFRVRHTEYASRLRLAGQELRLRIDRLDALASGGTAILDYKSGRRIGGDWYGDRPSHPQLLAYLAAVGEGVVPWRRSTLRREKSDSTGLPRATVCSPRWRESGRPRDSRRMRGRRTCGNGARSWSGWPPLSPPDRQWSIPSPARATSAPCPACAASATPS